jgi:uncharacterized protein
MIGRIPQKIDHIRYTDQGTILDGVIEHAESTKELIRFNDAILKDPSDIHYHLEFDVDLLGNRYVKGQLSTQVILQCQRCMENFELDLSCEISTAFVMNEHQEQSAEDSKYDLFWLSPKEYVDPRIIIEDELLLALPQVAMHPLSEVGTGCKAEVVFLDTDSEQKNSFDAESDDSEQMDNNPFAILKQLKK